MCQNEFDQVSKGFMCYYKLSCVFHEINKIDKALGEKLVRRSQINVLHSSKYLVNTSMSEVNH